MDRLVVTTDVYVPVEDAYEFLLEFPRYERYTEYLQRVARTHGDGGPGSRYAMRFAWWKLTYTAYSEVTDVDPPHRIDWRVLKDLNAHGAWHFQAHDTLPVDAPEQADTATEITFEVRYDAGSVDGGTIGLPSMVSLEWVLNRVKPLVREEAERVVRRAVTDLEGQERPVELDVKTAAD